MEKLESFCKTNGIIALITGILVGAGVGAILKIPESASILFLFAGLLIATIWNFAFKNPFNK